MSPLVFLYLFLPLSVASYLSLSFPVSLRFSYLSLSLLVAPCLYLSLSVPPCASLSFSVPPRRDVMISLSVLSKVFNILTIIKLCRVDNKLRLGLISQIGRSYCSVSQRSTCNLFLLIKFTHLLSFLLL